MLKNARKIIGMTFEQMKDFRKGEIFGDTVVSIRKHKKLTVVETDLS